MPGGQAQERIEAEQQAQRAVAHLGPEAREGVHHVGQARTVKFPGVHPESRQALEGRLQHAQAQCLRRHGRGPVGRKAAGNEADLGKTEPRQQLVGRPQVAHVNGIEGAAENTPIGCGGLRSVRLRPSGRPRGPA